MMAALLSMLTPAVTLSSSPDLGVAAGVCRAGEKGPAFLVHVEGLKDRQGRLRAELYPPREGDFLADDNILVAAGKTFARVDMAPPASGPVILCIRVPGAGAYTLSLLHDRNANRKFDLSTDGIGFSGNPRLGWSKPSAASATIAAGAALTPITIRLNYRRGLGLRPLEDR
jgi:uncharacterized protein (DUF2141 family)